MAEEETPKEEVEIKKKGGKRLSKIPSEILFSPGGMVLLFFALVMEAIDFLIPIPGACWTIELLIELFFILLLVIIAKTPFKSLIIPFIIERVPGISDIVPTWVIRMIF
jgi:hypothetical protein